MKRCPTCSFENVNASLYCERCGTSLQVATLYGAGGADYTLLSARDAPPPPPPPPVQYQATPSYASPPPPSYQYQDIRLVQPSRTVGHALLSIILYLFAALSTTFGLFFILSPFLVSNANAAIFVSSLVFSIILLVIVLILHKQPLLRWWHRLLWALSIGICGFFALLIWAIHANTMHNTNPDQAFGLIFFLGGLLLAVASLW